jgi:hypothetical protein
VSLILDEECQRKETEYINILNATEHTPSDVCTVNADSSYEPVEEKLKSSLQAVASVCLYANFQRPSKHT